MLNDPDERAMFLGRLLTNTGVRVLKQRSAKPVLLEFFPSEIEDHVGKRILTWFKSPALLIPYSVQLLQNTYANARILSSF